MKSLKKVFAIAFIGIFAVGMLAACGGGGGNEPAGSSAAPAGSGSSAAPAGSGAVATGDVLKMATESTFPPYEYYEGDEIVGIDIDIAKAIAEKLGMKLEVEDMAFDSIVMAVKTGKVDIGMAGMTITEDRLKNISFSDPYTNAVQVILLPEGSEIKSIDDLEGKKIAVQTGTTGDIYASDIKDAQIESFTKSTDGVLALTTGKVDAMIIDNEPAKSFVANNEGIYILEEDFANEDYAIAVAKENTVLLEKINKALGELKDSGELDKIIGKYISGE